MARVSILTRIFNLFRGLLSGKVDDMEKKQPAVAYQNSIDAMVEKYGRLKSSSAAIMRRREDLDTRRKTAETKLSEVNRQLEQAIVLNQDDLGGILIQKKEELEGSLLQINEQWQQAVKEADNAKQTLMEVKAEIESIKAEKDQMLALLDSSAARTHIRDQLSGLSVDEEIRALDNVRNHIKNKVAEANLTDELEESDLDRRLAKLTREGAGVVAQNKFAALKAASSAKQSEKQAEGRTL